MHLLPLVIETSSSFFLKYSIHTGASPTQRAVNILATMLAIIKSALAQQQQIMYGSWQR